MALNPANLASEMSAALGVSGNSAAEAANLSLATVIINHFIANGVISTTDTVPSLGLISPGGLTPAPVTGAASGTGVGTIS